MEHSTEYAALELIDRVIIEMDKKNTPINVFLDLLKAFNTINHTILLEKLKYHDIDGIALELMESYRTQYVKIDGVKSDLLNLLTGEPQGSILGPLLFIIYITDIANASKLFDLIIYADDTALSTTLEIIYRHTNNNSNNNNNTEEMINAELNNINE